MRLLRRSKIQFNFTKMFLDQLDSENIKQEVDINTFIIHWKMWAWKTLLSIAMSTDYYKRVYSNFSIFQNWKLLNKTVNAYSEIENIRFSYTPWILIIDEAWINANSKDWRTWDSRILQELLFLTRKKNLTLIWIAQRYESIDINARVLADCIFEIIKIHWKKHPRFIINKQKQKRGSQVLDWKWSYNFDLIWFLDFHWLTYNQLETSRLKKTPSKKELEQE